MHNVLLFRTFQKICTASSRFSPVSVRFFVLFLSPTNLRDLHAVFAATCFERSRQSSTKICPFGQATFPLSVKFSYIPGCVPCKFAKKRPKAVHYSSGNRKRACEARHPIKNCKRACEACLPPESASEHASVSTQAYRHARPLRTFTTDERHARHTKKLEHPELGTLCKGAASESAPNPVCRKRNAFSFKLIFYFPKS